MGLNTYPYNPFPASTDKLDEAHNEQIQAEIDQVKNDVTNLNNEIYGDSITYPYADVITIESAVPSNLAGCIVKIEPVQSGSGDPSPENVRPITGHTEASVQRNGKNFCPYAKLGATSEEFLLPSGNYTFSFKLLGSAKYSTSNVRIVTGEEAICTILPYGKNPGTVLSAQFELTESSMVQIRHSNMNADADGYFEGDIQIELGSTATPYVPYSGKTYTIALGDTIYGGTVDFDSGVMTVTHKYVDLGDYTWSYNSNNQFYTSGITDFAKDPIVGTIEFAKYCICEKYKVAKSVQSDAYLALYYNTSYSGYRCFVLNDPNTEAMEYGSEFKTYITGTHICYELATPTTIQLTPQQIQLLQGQNTFTASTGQISVTVNGVSGSIGAVQTQANATDEALAELAADIAEQLPTAPTTDGAYVLTVTVADGTPTYSWESAS